MKLKICGIRSLEEIKELKSLNIDYFGCIFAQSPRKVTTELATKITNIAHKNGKKAVGVFVNEEISKIANIIKETDIDIIQLHGNETPEYCIKLLEKLYKFSGKKNIKLWKAFSVKESLPNIAPYLPYIEFPLFDAKGENQGGNGIVFNWEILKTLDNTPFILAGGLSHENITESLKYNPTILDVNSKVEINNKKNRQLIEEIIKIIK